MADNKIDYSWFVGKVFKTKKDSGLNSDRILTIANYIPKFDFGTSAFSTSRGRKEAFEIHRERGGKHTEECEKFLAAHEEVTEEETPAAA